ncbi:MAG: DUF4129 domain-containing protein [Methylobacter sp.]
MAVDINALWLNQGIILVSATFSILLLGAVLYALTPQVSWLRFSSAFGLPTNIAMVSGDGSNKGRQGSKSITEYQGAEENSFERSPWPTPAEMRLAVLRVGMPYWQSNVIMTMADVAEALQQLFDVDMKIFSGKWDMLNKWLHENFAKLIASLLALILLVLLIVLLLLMREARAGIWLRTRFDYWFYVVLRRHAFGREGVLQFYRALERLFALHGEPRHETSNTREYLRQMSIARPALRFELSAVTRQFEDARYGAKAPDSDQVQAMRERYRRVFRALSE